MGGNLKYNRVIVLSLHSHLPREPWGITSYHAPNIPLMIITGSSNDFSCIYSTKISVTIAEKPLGVSQVATPMINYCTQCTGIKHVI